MTANPVWAFDHAGELADALGVDQSRIRVSLETGDVTILEMDGSRGRVVLSAEVERLLQIGCSTAPAPSAWSRPPGTSGRRRSCALRSRRVGAAGRSAGSPGPMCGSRSAGSSSARPSTRTRR
jgi:hypothetical protein